MQRYLLTLIAAFGLRAAVSADTIRATVNGMVCGFCATGIEKTFRAQPKVKSLARVAQIKRDHSDAIRSPNE